MKVIGVLLKAVWLPPLYPALPKAAQVPVIQRERECDWTTADKDN